ncbi:hypothetical protein K9M18_05330 [Candidatus Woesearchaeota archaeon]|nr:hypothetical protein [Candidatus Woesearchaeota archaeon]MCF8013589.1 hypothetical protein [Candidatus Woesearchaeota archaeon]
MAYSSNNSYNSNCSSCSTYESKSGAYLPMKKNSFKGVCNRTCISVGKCTCK